MSIAHKALKLPLEGHIGDDVRRSSPPGRCLAMVRIVACVAAFLLAVGTAANAAGPVRATASVERGSITIGDLVLLTLVVDTDAGHRVVDPGVVGGIGPFELRESLRPELEELAAGATRHIFRYRITAFALGDHTIQPIDVTYQDPAGGRGVARTEALTVTVRSVIRDGEDTSDIKRLKPQLEVADPLARIGAAMRALSYALVVLTAVAVVLNRDRNVRGAAAVPTPAERTLRELQRIAALRLPDQGRFAEHYELISGCLRRYARERYGIPAASRTPRELRSEMSRTPIDAGQAAMIGAVLVESERVRFGRDRMRPEDAYAAVQRASAALTDAVAMTAPAERQ